MNYIAGENISTAIQKCRALNKIGAMCTIDHLGESVSDEGTVRKTVDIYLRVLEEISQEKLDSNISIKPTSFGALLSQDNCLENIRKVVKKAHELGNFVRIDMEDHPYTDMTLKAYEELRREFPNSVGVVLQSYLKRTKEDADKLSQGTKANFRLCKGIYNESEKIAYKGIQINENFLETLDLMFSRSAYVGIATHDDKLVDGALKLIEKHQLTKEQYEFQMLLGVRSSLRDQIIAQGHRMRIYLPFGGDWHAYTMRRFKENPDIVGSVLKGFFVR